MFQPRCRRGSVHPLVLIAIAAGFLFVLMCVGAGIWLFTRSRASAPAPVAVPGPTPVAVPAEKLSDEELTEFAKAFEDAFAAGDMSAIQSMIDVDALNNRVFTGMDVKPEFTKGFGVGLRQGIGSLVREVASGSANGGYVFLRLREVDGEQRLLFRLAPDSGGINYHEVIPVRDASGAIKMGDAYIYLAGETISETMRRMAIPALAQFDKSWMEKLGQSDREFVDHYDKFGKLNQLRQTGQYAEGLELYRSLPEELQAVKPARLVRLMMAQGVSEQEYLSAMEDFRKAYPNDPALLLTEIDYHFLRKDYEALRNTIKQLNAAVGGDPYLDSLLARLLIAADELKLARETAEANVASYPDYQDAYWGLITVVIHQKDNAAILHTLKEMDQHFAIEWNDLTTAPDYADFVQSPEYQEWLAYLAQKSDPAPSSE